MRTRPCEAVKSCSTSKSESLLKKRQSSSGGTRWRRIKQTCASMPTFCRVGPRRLKQDRCSLFIVGGAPELLYVALLAIHRGFDDLLVEFARRNSKKLVNGR